jgi:single-stranded-DNA-specific exonuclease
MSETKWEIQHKFSKPNFQFSNEKLIDVLLGNRGIKTKKAKQEFLNPKHPNDFTPKDVGISEKEIIKAVKRIKEAVKNKEQVIVYGDYDADGICATAILWEALDSLGAKAIPFIPDRFEDGYGINPESVKKLKEKYKDLSLIITVDNGIVAYDALREANNLEIDVIVTDHHTYEKKPKSFSVVHTAKTSGSGVAYFLARALTKKSEGLELAAIGTIADQLPLVDINRSIVKFGLEELNSTKRLGLKKLLMVSGLIGKKLGTYEVGFLIAPRINASGRIAQGMDALRLLCTRSRVRAEKLAKLLNDLNSERQDIVVSSVKIAEKNFPKNPTSVIVMSHEDYHEGVIGLIAGKVVEKYSRPAIVMSVRGKVAKASARSVDGFSIIDAIRAHEHLIIEGGGHDMAAGFSIDIDNIDEFSAGIQKHADSYFDKNKPSKTIKIDCELDVDDVDMDLYQKISQLEPFGSANPTPVFVTFSVNVDSIKSIGSAGRHRKLSIARKTGKIDALKFNSDEDIEIAPSDIVYKLSLNEWNGKKSVEMIIRDIKKS